MRRLVALSSVVLCLSGCDTSTPDTVPPRATDAIAIKPQSSLIAVPLSADLSQLTATLEREVPRRLWAIDKPGQVCVASDKIKVLFVEMKTPTIKCHIVGQVTRGRLSLSGSGHNLVLSMPVHAVIHARDIAGVLKQETASADAQMQARIDLDVGPDWQPRGKVDLAYRWTAPPTVDFLGQKIDLSEPADAKLKGVIAQLERTLPGQLGKLQLREQAQQAWNAGFTSLLLNRAHPPVWMRVTPQELQYGGYDIANNRLTLRLGLRAVTETFVGPRPANPTITPLPPLSRLTNQPGNLSFFIPVIADYRELQPVLLKALNKRQVRPFRVPGVGPVWARFNSATIYGTTGGRIAVGLNLNASDEAGTIAFDLSRGEIAPAGFESSHHVLAKAHLGREIARRPVEQGAGRAGLRRCHGVRRHAARSALVRSRHHRVPSVLSPRPSGPPRQRRIGVFVQCAVMRWGGIA